ncbi:MAG: hypothetical protein ACK566_02080 [Bacteroidota bacterium]
MIKYSRFVVAVFSLLFALPVLSQKSKSDTSSTNSQQIKQQAVEMRNKVNKYIADKLNTEEPGSGVVSNEIIDSLISRLTRQDTEIDALNKRMLALEKLVSEQAKNRNKKIDSHRYSEDATLDDITDVTPGSYALIGNNKLLLFYAFDAYRLNVKQISAIRKFLSNKTASVIQMRAYTDDVGTEKYNAKLATNRCNTALKNVPKQTAKIMSMPEAGCGSVNTLDKEKCRRVEIILEN